jgi:L-threonylcarbamoyladenylate synthase
MQYQDDILSCLDVLRNGGLILYPTDTVWGIGCDATNAKAVEKIYKLKERNEAKSMIILVSNETEILNYTNQPSIKIYDYLKGVKKPTTVIYNDAKNLADNLSSQDNTIAMRIVKDDFCKELIRQLSKPIVSTSANVSGYPTPAIFNDIDILIKRGVDYVVNHRQNEIVPGNPSTIIKLNKDDTFSIIRD